MPAHSQNVVAYSKHGPIIINSFDRFIGASILKTGGWEEHNIDLLVQMLSLKLQSKQRVRYYDVGANIGTHVLALAKRFGPKIEVRAFEAQPAIFHMLCGTLALNGLLTVSAHLNAVSDEGEKK
jgi:hypothetical protein